MSEPILNVGFRMRDTFFDRAAVVNRVDEATRQRLSKAGAYIRTRARSSIRRPRRLRLSELPAERQSIFEIRRKVAARNGTPAPVLPDAPSRPGEPPRSATRRLPDSIFFGYDDASRSVLVGPIKLNAVVPDIPATLEAGGRESLFGRNVTIEARPFMGPALRAEVAKLPELFEGLF